MDQNRIGHQPHSGKSDCRLSVGGPYVLSVVCSNHEGVSALLLSSVRSFPNFPQVYPQLHIALT
jgi:hypothetical protein